MQGNRFRWHDASRLLTAGKVIPRDPTGFSFVRIDARDNRTALAALGAALARGNSFCVSEQALNPEITGEPPHFLTLTGGTSGQPKVIRRTQASWIASFEVNARKFDLNADDTVAVLGRLSHSLSLYGLVEAAYLGADAFVLEGLLPAAQIESLWQASVLYTTPAQLRLLCQGARQTRLPNLRLLLSGGGTLDTDTKEAAHDLFPQAALHEFYGAAETSFITMTDATTPAGSVGRAYPGVTLDIRDGQVWVKSPYLFDGYEASGSTAATADGGFISVGEMGEIDAAGNLWLHGRASRMVRIAEHSVFPEAAEAVIATTTKRPGVVIAIPDLLRGHHLVAVLEGAPDQTLADDLLQNCRKMLGALASPRKVLFHSGLPLLPSGKPDILSLTDWAEAQS